MKLIPENIAMKGKWWRYLQFLLLCIAYEASGQDVAPDTAAVTHVVIDSNYTIEQPDTSIPAVNYFDHLSDHKLADSLEMRGVPTRVIDSLKNDDDFWYADKAFHEKTPEPSQRKDIKAPSRWMNMPMLVVIVAIFIALLLTYLFQNNIIRRRGKIIVNEEETGTAEENIFEINYQREIEKAVQAANYRFAIRLMFLRLLKRLSQENIIQYKQERTNSDYLMQLGATSYYNDFFRLTRNFEYAWYGKFDVNADAFSHIRNDFEKFDQKLS